jgi:hypothetical protein
MNLEGSPMDKYTLTAIDTSGIQRYIFGSNSLKHNIGASALVNQATHDWVYETLDDLGSTNVSRRGKLDDVQTIEASNLNSELVYAGGGNAVIIFRTHELAVQFTKAFTRRVVQIAPGLEVIVGHKEFDWQDDPLPRAVRETMEYVSHKKAGRVAVSSPLLGLGVTADCQFTGLPAVGVVGEGDEKRRVSAEVLVKWQEADAAHERLVQALGLPGEYDVPKDFDEFGRTRGESSYIAVIHTDGNGMGRRVQAIADSYLTPGQNREYIQAIRAFSGSVAAAADWALKATTQQLIDAIDENDSVGGVVELSVRQSDGKKLVPFRPIVFGGDDVTFVCDGRLGLTLTEHYLRQFTSRDLEDGKPPYARAGIAVVKTHYPFARAYALAEELADSAKAYIVRQTNGEKNLTALDWHFAVGGLVLGLGETRQREYATRIDGHPARLLMRPLRLGPPSGADWHSWEVFRNILYGFNDPDGGWYGHRSKVKALRDALRSGPEAVEQFLTLAGVRLPQALQVPEMAESGWRGFECGYFDAVEAMEFFVPLEGGGR